MAGKVIPVELAHEAARLVHEHGGIRPACRATGMAYRTLYTRFQRAKQLELDLNDSATPIIDVEPVIRGRVHALPREQWDPPKKGKVNRYIFTCAQNNTNLHEPTWRNLQALAAHYDASIHVSTLTYDLASYGASSVKRGKAKPGDGGEPWWPAEVLARALDRPVVIAPGLVWCGEMNIIPTAVRPLSGLESYTGRKSGIFPHVKIAMESIASGKFEATKFNYTTGTITQRNYIQKKAGQKAEFHHSYGGLLVEVDDEGRWFARQLNADSEGTIYDLHVRSQDGKVTLGHRAEAVQWGDIHRDRVSSAMLDLLWGDHGMLNDLSPRYQFLHDVLDFRPRNHHEMRNFHRMYAKFREGNDDVMAELQRATVFLGKESKRDWCESIVVRSNHDAAFDRWLREADYKEDLKNARFFLEAQLAFVTAIDDGNKDFMPFEWACRKLGVGDDVKFLKQDESFVICKDANGGIECGHHGDKGANGAKGSLSGFAKSGRKINIGDKHSAGIHDGTYLAGVAGDMDHGYNQGMSSWSNSHTVTYANGKRAIITVWDGKWKA